MHRDSDEVTAFVTAEEGVSLPSRLPQIRLDHHHAHAATAFLTSTFENAAVLVCDQHTTPEISVWLGTGDRVTNQHWPWSGPAFASLFAQCSSLFGFGPGQEHRLEALGRVDSHADINQLPNLFAYAGGRIRVDPNWQQAVSDWLHVGGPRWTLEHGARVAGSLQKALGEALLELIADVRRQVDVNRLCLAGGLFYNTFYNTLIARSGCFDDIFVPPNPGNAGIAAGAALAMGREKAESGSRQAVSGFLGPEYNLEQIKSTLDNCKLSYECLDHDAMLTTCVEALAAGRLVGWFQGRMEWGHRALGNRSILASPFSPYVLDNLNGFLKQRERHRAYGLSVCEDDAPNYFLGPPRSRWMEYDYEVNDRDRFRSVLPAGVTRLRVQTVDGGPPLFRELHRAFAAATGAGVLVNTSFNGFSEPIVCSPRDAIRVFYGTGLDLLVLGQFVIRK
ncbi:MAG: carbamoyltransferase C-terminal domain-containing protein [Vicinamibacterales bacterium]